MTQHTYSEIMGVLKGIAGNGLTITQMPEDDTIRLTHNARNMRPLDLSLRELYRIWRLEGSYGVSRKVSGVVMLWLCPPARCAPPLRKRIKRERLKSTLSPKHWMGAA